MRPIKFRFWDKKKKEMLAPSDVGRPVELPQHDYDWKGVVPMQYTGLHDSEGSEVYEGDILVNVSNGHADEVVFHAGSFWWNVRQVEVTISRIVRNPSGKDTKSLKIMVWGCLGIISYLKD